MKRLLVVLLLVSVASGAVAQTYDPSKVKKKAVTLYDQAMQRAQDGNLVNAAGLLLQCIEIDKNYLDAYLSLAGVYGELKNYRSSTDYYERSFAMDSGYTIEYRLPYSINLAGLGEWQKALDAVNYLLDRKPPKNSTSLKAAEYRRRCYQFAVDYASNINDASYKFDPVNLGPSINSTESEYFPSLTIDQQELIFTRRLKGTNEEFFNSVQDKGAWTKAAPIQGFVNTEMNEGAQTISQDGQWLVFTGCNRPNGFGSCDLYISYREGDRWGEPENLGGRINTDQWESQPCLSPDKRDLYFASNRFGGLGGIDLYVSHLGDNGKWGEPENLGPAINTSGDDQSPFIHADNQTLYFTSNFWPGYGDADLFVSRKGPNSAWSKPVNLGYPVNTINHEGTLFIAAEGSTAYYSSDRSDSRGGLDIYSFTLREAVRPFTTFWAKGKVFDKNTSKGLPSSVELIDLATGSVISKTQTDERGNYLITLPSGRDYAFNVNRRGYLFYSEHISMNKDYRDSTFRKDIPLEPIELNASVVLNNIFFDVNKFEVRKESLIELDRVVQLMNDNPGLKLEIGGHTDNDGKPADNLLLSNNRAKAVMAYLVSKNISAARLTAKGFGSSKPVDSNETEAGKARNRRTEIRVTGK